MAIVTENDPIDGSELKQIILARIESALNRDSTLANDIAYAGFRLDYRIDIVFKRANTEKTLIWGGVQEGDIEGGETLLRAESYETDSPNRAREEHDLGIPVMVPVPGGVEKRRIKLGRPPNKKVEYER
jgi:hypothetical protein